MDACARAVERCLCKAGSCERKESPSLMAEWHGAYGNYVDKNRYVFAFDLASELKNWVGKHSSAKETPHSSAPNILPPATKLPKEVPQSSKPTIRPPATISEAASYRMRENSHASKSCHNTIGQALEEVLEKHSWLKVALQLDIAIRSLDSDAMSTFERQGDGRVRHVHQTID